MPTTGNHPSQRWRSDVRKNDQSPTRSESRFDTPCRGVVTWKREIYNQDGKPVQESITQTLVEGRGMLKDQIRDKQESQTPATNTNAG